TQARSYPRLLALVSCDPTVATLALFHLIDEPLMLGFQSGLLRGDGSRRPSYAAAKKAIAAGHTCAGPHAWRHTTSVVGARAGANLSDKLAAQRVFWTTISTEEEATVRTGIFAATDGVAPAPRALRTSLTVGPVAAA